MLGYLNKQLRHFRATLPRLWRLYERAAETETGLLVVGLRARDRAQIQFLIFKPEC